MFFAYFMAEKGILEPFGNLFLLNFSLMWDLVDPKFNEYRSAFTPPPTPLRQNPHQYPLSLPLIPTKRYALVQMEGIEGRYGRRKIRAMISLEDVSWH